MCGFFYLFLFFTFKDSYVFAASRPGLRHHKRIGQGAIGIPALGYVMVKQLYLQCPAFFQPADKADTNTAKQNRARSRDYPVVHK